MKLHGLALALAGCCLAVALAQRGPPDPGGNGNGPPPDRGNGRGRPSLLPAECDGARKCMRSQISGIIGLSGQQMRGMRRRVMRCARPCIQEAIQSGNVPSLPEQGPDDQDVFERIQCGYEFEESVRPCLEAAGLSPPPASLLPGGGAGPARRSKRSPFGPAGGALGGPMAGMLALGYINEILADRCPTVAEQTLYCLQDATHNQIDFSSFDPDEIFQDLGCESALRALRDDACQCLELGVQQLQTSGNQCPPPPLPPACDPTQPDAATVCAGQPPTLDEVLQTIMRQADKRGRGGPPPPPGPLRHFL